MNQPLSVAVLVSAGQHPVSGVPRVCRGDAVAMGLGHALAGEALRIVHVGSPDEPSLADYMAYGASSVEVVAVRAGDAAVPAAAAALQSVDVILTGSRAERGACSGVFPYALAEALSRPVVANALEVQISQDGAGSAVRIRQFLPKGQRRQIGCPSRVVISVHPFAPVSLKYAYARRVAGKIKITEGPQLAGSGLTPEWVVEKGFRRPVRLQAQEKKAGHARLLSAIASEAKGGVVAFEGTTVDKAQVVLNYLREHRLVDF